MAALPFNATQDSLDATSAASDPAPSCGSSATFSVWYSYTPTSNGTIQASTSGGDFFPPTPTAYTGPAHATASSALTEVACSNSGSVQLDVSAGVTYYFLLGSYSPRPSFTFTVQTVVPPANDDIAGAIPIGSLPFSNSQSGQYATQSPHDPTPSCGAFNTFTIWYSYTPSAAGTIQASAAAAYTGPTHATSSSPLVEAACSTSGTLQFTVTAGSTYYFLLGSPIPVATITFTAQTIVPPSNDDVSGATTVPSLPFSATQDSLTATPAASDPTPSCGSPLDFSVWYSYTPIASGTIQASTSGGDSFPPTPTAYTGPAHATTSSALKEAACSTSGTVQLTVTAGTTYYFLLGSYSAPRPTFTFTVQAIVPPSNDDISGATTVTALPFSATQDSLTATPVSSDPTPSCGSPGGYSVWYSYTPTANATIQVSTSGGDFFPPTPTAYTGPAHATTSSPLHEVACAQGTLQFSVIAGTTYYFMLTSVSPRPTFTFTVQAIVPPSNDDISGATIVTELPFSASQDNLTATPAASDPSPSCGSSAGFSVWYSYTPTTKGTIQVSATGGDLFPPTPTAYTGPAHATTSSPLREAACSTSGMLQLNVTAGTTYYFLLASNIPRPTFTFSIQPVPTVVPGSASVVEGNSGTTTLQVPVTLSNAATLPVTVQWTTLHANGAPGHQAEPVSDYAPVSGIVTFNPGDTAKTIAVPVVGDTAVEPDEYVVVSFHDATNATIGGFWGLGFGTITNDDQPTVLPGTASVVEGNSGTTSLQVPVTLSSASTVPVTVQWATLCVSGAPGHQADPAADYLAASGTVTFNPGETAKTITIQVLGDHLVEPDEYVVVSFHDAINAGIGGFWGLGFGTITNDD